MFLLRKNFDNKKKATNLENKEKKSTSQDLNDLRNKLRNFNQNED